jgi:hypothetical protein
MFVGVMEWAFQSTLSPILYPLLLGEVDQLVQHVTTAVFLIMMTSTAAFDLGANGLEAGVPPDKCQATQFLRLSNQ